jgi:ubiquinone/menaquinone biosynthesis C-methylase UbiE
MMRAVKHTLTYLLLSYTLVAEDKPLPTAESTQATATPAPPTYMGRSLAPTMHWMGAAWLIRHKREREEAAQQMRQQLKLQPGMTVCDMGCGNGYHTLPIAQAVGPDGKVYAVDIQPEMLRMLDEKAQQQSITNIKSLLGTETDPKLPEGSCDLILMVDVYHEFSKPDVMLATMRKALKPTGKIVLVEFRAEDPEVPIKPEHKMSKEQILKELTANGYEPAESYDILPWQHMMWFRVKAP